MKDLYAACAHRNLDNYVQNSVNTSITLEVYKYDCIQAQTNLFEWLEIISKPLTFLLTWRDARLHVMTGCIFQKCCHHVRAITAASLKEKQLTKSKLVKIV